MPSMSAVGAILLPGTQILDGERRWGDAAAVSLSLMRRDAMASGLRAGCKTDVEAHVIHASSVGISGEPTCENRPSRYRDANARLPWLAAWREAPLHHDAIPVVEFEDARRPSREREKLICDRTRISSRRSAKPRKSSMPCKRQKGRPYRRMRVRNCAVTRPGCVSCASRSERSSRSACAKRGRLR
jgi:hypothetical protein